LQKVKEVKSNFFRKYLAAAPLLLLLCAPRAAAQPLSVQEAIESIVEQISSLEEGDENLEVIHELLTGYAQNPLNLNTASEAELLQLHVLNEFQASSLREYIAQYGEMQTPYELQYVYGITPQQMELLLPFVTAAPVAAPQKPTLRRMLMQGHHQVVGRARQTLEQQQGYKPATDSALALHPNSRYLGSPQNVYLRYRYGFSDKLQWGLTAEKDAGEPFGKKGNPAGFDFYSGHIQLSNVGCIRTLVVGDYYAQLGQGLTLWHGGVFGKSSDALNVAKRGVGVKAYGGANESSFFRGAAACVNVTRRLAVTAFFSYKNVDANADTLGAFSTLQTTGLHNTPKTMSEKHAISEVAAGANVSCSMSKLRVGVTGLWHGFGGSYQKDVQPYSYHELRKNSNANLSADYKLFFKKAHLFGELGVSQSGGLAAVNGLQADVAPQLQLTVLHRYYEPHYQAYYANAFSDGGKTANENGFYVGAAVFPHPKLKAALYFDAFTFPWLRYKAFAPSKGFDLMLRTDYTPQQSCKMYLLLRCNEKEENVSSDRPTKTLGSVEKLHLRYSISYRLLAGLDCENRVEVSRYRAGARERGVMLFQDVRYSLQRQPLTFSLRYAMFNTDSYNTRIYAYESDVLYAFSVPAYYGQGSRWFINLQWQPASRVDVWLRVAQTYYFDRNAIGSGLTMINANHQTDVKVQMRVKI